LEWIFEIEVRISIIKTVEKSSIPILITEHHPLSSSYDSSSNLSFSIKLELLPYTAAGSAQRSQSIADICL